MRCDGRRGTAQFKRAVDVTSYTRFLSQVDVSYLSVLRSVAVNTPTKSKQYHPLVELMLSTNASAPFLPSSILTERLRAEPSTRTTVLWRRGTVDGRNERRSAAFVYTYPSVLSVFLDDGVFFSVSYIHCTYIQSTHTYWIERPSLHLRQTCQH